ncbi:hypothetical protein GTID1_04365 [Geobacillus thermodenitrificans]|nr:hypothetical protein GTID1_04365 [Geobacillus thermodenitrificans]NNU85715.1 hypothetical protein [Geobacillus sp. MR]
MILHHCSVNLPSQSIILAKNHIRTDIVAKALAGFHPIDEGEIHFDEQEARGKTNKSVFFVIPENYHQLWRNYRLQDISIWLNRPFQQSTLWKKYRLPSHASIDSLTMFQRLIYFVSLGQSLNRTVFIFDQPTKHFDFEDLERFYHFLRHDFADANYMILSNRIENGFTDLSIYQIHNAKLVAFERR